MTEEEELAIVMEVERIYANIPPRKTISVAAAGVVYFLVNGLFLECTGCTMHIPQSRSRQSPAARDRWLRLHVKCRRA